MSWDYRVSENPPATTLRPRDWGRAGFQAIKILAHDLHLPFGQRKPGDKDDCGNQGACAKAHVGQPHPSNRLRGLARAFGCIVTGEVQKKTPDDKRDGAANL